MTHRISTQPRMITELVYWDSTRLERMRTDRQNLNYLLLTTMLTMRTIEGTMTREMAMSRQRPDLTHAVLRPQHHLTTGAIEVLFVSHSVSGIMRHQGWKQYLKRWNCKTIMCQTNPDHQIDIDRVEPTSLQSMESIDLPIGLCITMSRRKTQISSPHMAYNASPDVQATPAFLP